MSEMTKLTRRRKRRDRSKTNSAVITGALFPNFSKRPFDEINSSNSNGIKRRAVSATTGSENQICSVVIIDNQSGKTAFK